MWKENLERGSGMETVQSATGTDGSAAQIYQVRQIRVYRSKRVIDFIIASIGLLLAAPFAAIIALLVRASGPGPVVFK